MSLLKTTPPPEVVEYLVPQVISVRPHDTTAFTEGLFLYDGALYESSGQYAQSSLRRQDPETGEILQRIEVPPQYFAEGIALVGDHLIQLTWKEDTALIYDAKTFEALGTFSYTGEGWGLCYDSDSQQLFMTDGSDTITRRDPQTFAALGQIHVTYKNQAVVNLNELECVGDQLYANVWLSDYILRIDKATGHVTTVINAAGLLTPEETAVAGSNGVLNGIAYDAQTGNFLITGKLWPKLFEVRFVPVAK